MSLILYFLRDHSHSSRKKQKNKGFLKNCTRDKSNPLCEGGKREEEEEEEKYKFMVYGFFFLGGISIK